MPSLPPVFVCVCVCLYLSRVRQSNGGCFVAGQHSLAPVEDCVDPHEKVQYITVTSESI